MAGESTLANATLLAAIAEEAKPFFRTNVVMMNLMARKVFMKSLDFNKKGNVTAYTTAEASSVTKSTYTETKVTLSPTKASVYVEPTIEALELGGDPYGDNFAEESGKAIAQTVDNAGLALADSFTNSVGLTGVAMTVNTFKDASYKLTLNKIPGPYASVCHPTTVRDFQSDIITTSAPVYSASNMDLAILGGQPPQVNGFKGAIFDVGVYVSTNVKSINTNTDWANLVFSPQWALAFAIGERIIPQGTDIPQTGVVGSAFHLLYNVAVWDLLAGVYAIGKQ
jgi:hypothetical protein